MIGNGNTGGYMYNGASCRGTYLLRANTSSDLMFASLAKSTFLYYHYARTAEVLPIRAGILMKL